MVRQPVYRVFVRVAEIGFAACRKIAKRRKGDQCVRRRSARVAQFHTRSKHKRGAQTVAYRGKTAQRSDFGYRVERGEAVVEQRRMHEIAACAAVYRPHLGAQPVGVQFGDRSVKTFERLRPASAVKVYQPDRKLFGSQDLDLDGAGFDRRQRHTVGRFIGTSALFDRLGQRAAFFPAGVC